MPCPTCDRTMQNLGIEDRRVFWCPSCGTVKSIDPGGFESISQPKLVARVKASADAGKGNATFEALRKETTFFAMHNRTWEDVREACGLPKQGE